MKTITRVHIGLVVSSTIVAALVTLLPPVVATGLISVDTADGRAIIVSWMWCVQLVSLALCSAGTDLSTHRIPNQLTYTSIIGSLVLLALSFFDSGLHTALVAPGDALLGGAMCGLLMGSLWLMGKIGGGDVKLLIAIGLLLGCQTGMAVLLAGHLIAAASVVAGVVIQQLTPQTVPRLVIYLTADVSNGAYLVQEIIPKQKRIPMGGFYAVGLLTVFLFKLLAA